ncbi:MAG: hypothetical protein ACK559_03335, partial [bacterium]
MRGPRSPRAKRGAGPPQPPARAGAKRPVRSRLTVSARSSSTGSVKPSNSSSAVTGRSQPRSERSSRRPDQLGPERSSSPPSSTS